MGNILRCIWKKDDHVLPCYLLRQGKDPIIFPSFWEPMKWKTVVGIDLDLDSQEVNRVCELFHRSLRYPVTRVVRIQTPRLWAQYYKKSKKMERERGGLRPLEYRLFHGTDSANVDSISSKGFEVGRAGSHRGVLYGRGIYFAKDSCLAHLYTACKIPTGCPHLLTETPLISSAVMDTREFHQIDYRHGWRSAHPLITATECMDSEGEEVTFSDQEDVMAKKSDLKISVHDHSYELPFFQEHLVTPVIPRTSGKQKRSNGGKRCSSSGYSYTETVGCRHYMFLCSVLVGSTVEGIPSDFMPPLKDPDDPNSRRHDSCYGCRNNVLEFAVFRSNQVYPEYLIEYNHDGASEVSTLEIVVLVILFVCLVYLVFFFFYSTGLSRWMVNELARVLISFISLF